MERFDGSCWILDVASDPHQRMGAERVSIVELDEGISALLRRAEPRAAPRPSFNVFLEE
jgi:hypothetical protein